MALHTWRELIAKEMAKHGESFDTPHEVAIGVRRTYDDYYNEVLTQGSLDEPFDTGFGAPEGCSFTLWTADRVYFPDCYDGAERCASVPRNPGEATPHVGSW